MSIQEKRKTAIEKISSLEDEFLLDEILSQLLEEDESLPAHILEKVIKRANEDKAAGRIHSHEEVVREMKARFK